MESSEPDDIAAQCTRVAELMDVLIETIANTEDIASGLNESELLDQQDRFLIWTGNFGPIASLRQQLSEAPQLQHHMVRVLTRLERSIVRATSIVTGSIPNRISYPEHEKVLEPVRNIEIFDDDDGDDEYDDDDFSSVSDTNSASSQEGHSTSELAELRRAINDTITNLFRMSVTIRTPPPRSRYERSGDSHEQAAQFGSPEILVQHRSKGKKAETPSSPSSLLSVPYDPEKDRHNHASQHKDVRSIVSATALSNLRDKENPTDLEGNNVTQSLIAESSHVQDTIHSIDSIAERERETRVIINSSLERNVPGQDWALSEWLHGDANGIQSLRDVGKKSGKKLHNLNKVSDHTSESLDSNIAKLETDVLRAEIKLQDTKEGTKEHATAEKNRKKAINALKIGVWRKDLYDVNLDLQKNITESTRRALMDKRKGLEAKLAQKTRSEK